MEESTLDSNHKLDPVQSKKTSRRKFFKNLGLVVAGVAAGLAALESGRIFQKAKFRGKKEVLLTPATAGYGSSTCRNAVMPANVSMPARKLITSVLNNSTSIRSKCRKIRRLPLTICPSHASIAITLPAFQFVRLMPLLKDRTGLF